MTGEEGHEGHDHPFINDELVEKLMRDMKEAKIIENLFLIPVNTGGQPRFVLIRVDKDNTIHTFGAIPFDMMLDVGIGFVQAVRNAMRLGMSTKGNEERPLFLYPIKPNPPDHEEDPPTSV